MADCGNVEQFSVNNLSKICRLCLSVESKLYCIFRIAEIETLAITLAMKVSLCTSIKVSKNDLLPRQICARCLEQINQWFKFRTNCIKSNDFLNNYITENQKLDKEEPAKDADSKFKYFDIDFNDIDCDLSNDDNFVDLSPNNIESVLDSHPFESDGNHSVDNILIENNSEPKEISQLRDIRISTNKLKRRKCNLCPDSFYLMKDLKHHTRVVHRRQANHGNTKPKKHLKYVSKTKRVKIPYTRNCGICNLSFTNKTLFRAHYSVQHPGEKPFACEVCGKKGFVSEETLRRHKMLHTGNYRCKTCGKTFTCNAILVLHIRDKHENDKPFVCDFCGKMFVTELLMNYHKRFHTGEKKFVCDECGLAVVTSSSLAKHKRIHRAIKPFNCQECHKGFVTKSRLTEHTRIHTGERPHACGLCNKAFTMKDKLTRHLRSHTKQDHYCGFETFHVKNEIHSTQ